MGEIVLAAANMVVTHEKRRNLRRMVELVEEAAAAHTKLLVFPELCLQGYADLTFPNDSPGIAEQKEYYFREAETLPGPATEEISELAKKHGMWIQFGLAEAALHHNVIYNSVALVGPNGDIGSYRKIHNQFEYPFFMPGNDAESYQTSFGTVAPLICYDICFPELTRWHALQGADLIAVSTAWPRQGRTMSEDYYGWGMDIAAQGLSFFNQIWLMLSNHCEKEAYSGKVDYYGHSKIIDPFGKVVAEAVEDEQLVMWAADVRSEVVRARTHGLFGKNFLQDWRPSCYGLTAETSRAPSGEQYGYEASSSGRLRAIKEHPIEGNV